MFEPAVVVLRLLQYAGAVVLMGSPLFFLYALPAPPPWGRPLVAGAGALLALAALLSIPAQAGALTGSLAEGLKPEALTAVATGMDLGKAALVRALAAALAVVLVLSLEPSRGSWILAAGLGATATASLAWMGHGAATEGPAGLVHLASDIVHSWAAAIWVGALVAFLLLLLAPARTAGATAALHRALQGFSGVGAGCVAVLVLTGLMNSAILVGWEAIAGLWTTPYGRLLSLKVALFAAMLGLAAANRYRFTPALASALEAPLAAQGAALGALRRSVVAETVMGVGVLALVAWFGTLPPPAAMP